jgi:hypothetical protein
MNIIIYNFELIKFNKVFIVLKNKRISQIYFLLIFL